MSEHWHKWRVTSSVSEASCVIACRCGAIVRVLRTGRGIRPEVLADGGRTFTHVDGQRVVLLAVSVIGSP
jgi:hypothetical protein